MTTPLITFNQVSFSYQEKNEVIKNISFSLNPGEAVGIVGPNGGGKSTLLKLIVGLLKPTSGTITYNNQQTISYVGQQSSLNLIMPITVLEFVKQGLINQTTSQPIDKVLKELNLWEKATVLIKNLSGGERQRAMIARSLVSAPKILILDEPNTGLDSTGVDQLYKIIFELKQKYQTAFIIVDHNLNLTITNCDKIICLNKTQHWHDKKDKLNRKILESIYHCEFEHLLIHSHNPDEVHEHHACADPHHKHEH